MSIGKQEYFDDWVSPRDQRFKISRYYSSDADSVLELGYPDQIKGIFTFSTWKSGFDEFISEFGTSPVSYRPADGRVLPLPAKNSPTGTKGGLPYKLIEVSPSLPDRWIEDGSGKRMRFQKYPGRSTWALVEIRWSDGYSINVERDASTFAINVVRDNKGNRAVFSGETIAAGNRRTTSVQIDPSFDGVNFIPEVELQYTYNDNVSAPAFRPLASVIRRDQVENTTQTLAIYTYFKTEHFWPPLLTSANRGGGRSSYFEYHTYGLGPVPALLPPLGGVMSSSRGTNSPYEFGIVANSPSLRQVVSENPLGLKTTYTYEPVDGYFMPTRVDGAAGVGCLATTRTLSYTPNSGAPLGFVYSRTERNGARTDFTRDARGLVLTMTENASGSASRVTTFTWHSTLRLPLTRRTADLLETFTYTSEGLVTSYSQQDIKVGSPTNGQVRSWTYTYNTLDNGLSVLTNVDGPGLATSGVADVSSYTYTSLGELITATDANGLVTTVLSRNEQGKPTLVEMPDKVRWYFSYDRAGQLLTSGYASSPNTPLLSTFTYDADGKIISFTNTLGKTWNFSYDAAGQIVQTIAPNADVANFTYDADGNLTRTEYRGVGNSVEFWEETEFDDLGRVFKAINAQGQQWSYGHDKEDNLVSETDPLNNNNGYAFDALNHIVTSTDRQNFTSSFSHNSADQLAEFTDPRLIKTTYTYNGFGDVIAETSADRGTASYTYNSRGLVTSRTDGRGITVNYAYDNGGRPVLIDYPVSTIPDVVLTYDAPFAGAGIDRNKGKIGQISDGIITNSFAHLVTSVGVRVTTLSNYPAGRSYTVVEDANFEGNATRVVYPSGREVLMSYNDAGQMTLLRVREGAVVTNLLSQITYASNGPMKTALYGDGYRQTRTYDLSYRLTGIKDQLGTARLRDVTFGYEARDNISSIADALIPANSENFSYTPRESLAGATGPYGALGYTYDGVGNRLTASLGAATDSYSYPSLSNRLTSISLASGVVRGYTYDAAGNVLAEARTGGGTYAYTYNAAGRMSEFRINNILQASYKYDAMGRQAIRTLTSPTPVTIHSVFDSEGRRIAEYNEGTGTLIREYVWNGWEPVAVIEGGVVYFIRADHIARPVFATNATGAKVWSATYQPFGGVHTSTGAIPTARLPGQWFQSESGLHQNWMRDYDPTTGRYLQADPLGLIAGMNVFGYANQSPMMYVDPNGENPLLFALAFGLASAAWNLLDQLDENGWRWECVNPWSVAGAGIAGAALGPAARAFGGSLLGMTSFGRGMSVNGLVGSSSNFRSYAYGAVSKRLRAANGLVGNKSVQLHHWAISQGSGLGQFLNGSRAGQAVLNSRLNLNPIRSATNASIGMRVFTPGNFWRGAPDWARFGPLGFGAGFGVGQLSNAGACGCE